MEFSVALAAWTAASIPELESVARIYHATVTYQDLGERVQERTGIRTRMLLPNWIGKVLGGASRESHRRGQPLVSSLCVHGDDGTVGDGYAEAVLENYGSVPTDIEMHAAEERLRCHQFFGADLPPGGSVPALTSQVAARRAWVARQQPRPQNLCSSCHIALPLSGICDNCS